MWKWGRKREMDSSKRPTQTWGISAYTVWLSLPCASDSAWIAEKKKIIVSDTCVFILNLHLHARLRCRELAMRKMFQPLGVVIVTIHMNIHIKLKWMFKMKSHFGHWHTKPYSNQIQANEMSRAQATTTNETTYRSMQILYVSTLVCLFVVQTFYRINREKNEKKKKRIRPKRQIWIRFNIRNKNLAAIRNKDSVWTILIMTR